MTCSCSCHETCERKAWNGLHAGHVSALRKLLLAVRYYGKNDIHIRDEMKRCPGAPFQLTDDEWTNFSHLRYHGLAHRADRENPKSGRWLLTLNGGRFLKGELAVPLKVCIQAGRVVDHSPERVTIAHFSGKRPEFRQMPEFDPAMPERVEAPAVRQATLV